MKRQTSFALIPSLLLAGAAFAQNVSDSYPNKPITLVVPYGAGGSTDITARKIAEGMGKVLKQSVVVENKPGGSTTVAAAQVARAPADGYTLMIGDSATFVYNKFLFKSLRYDPQTSFDPISLIANGSMVLAAGTATKTPSLEALVAKIKANPSSMKYASAGPGSPPHILMEAFLQGLGAKGVTHAPYRGEQPGLNDMMGGTIDFMFLGPRSAKTLSDAGKIHAIAWAGAKRNKDLPNLPAISEVVPGYEQQVWQAMVAPKGTPRPVIERLNKALRSVTESEDFTQWVKSQAIALDYSSTTPEYVTKLMESDQARVGKVISTANISMD